MLPAGGAAISPPECAGVLYHDARLSFERTGRMLGVLNVSVVYSEKLSLSVANLFGEEEWALSSPFNFPPPPGAGNQDVRFKLSALGVGSGSYQVYGLNVDPRMGS